MAGTAPDGTIEVVRGRMTEERADELLRFWSREGALQEDEAQRRLSEVICVLLDGSGAIAGVNSVYPQRVGLVAGRLFWMYRHFLLPRASSAAPEMIEAAFATLEEEFDPAAVGPIGVCLIVSDPAVMEGRPEAVWPDTQLTFAGYLDDGQQLRIRYFEGAAIGPGFPDSPALSDTVLDPPLEDRYRIEALDDSAVVTPEDVLTLWRSEEAMPEAEARRRLDEVELVAVDEAEELVGIASAYLQHNPQLRLELWFGRVFVASAHRHSNLGRVLMMRGREYLEQRFTSGEDTRGAGIVMEIENEGLKRYFNKGLWRAAHIHSTFIGENDRGDHVRVYYFPGAQVPAPGQQST